MFGFPIPEVTVGSDGLTLEEHRLQALLQKREAKRIALDSFRDKRRCMRVPECQYQTRSKSRSSGMPRDDLSDSEPHPDDYVPLRQRRLISGAGGLASRSAKAKAKGRPKGKAKAKAKPKGKGKGEGKEEEEEAAPSTPPPVRPADPVTPLPVVSRPDYVNPLQRTPRCKRSSRSVGSEKREGAWHWTLRYFHLAC